MIEDVVRDEAEHAMAAAAEEVAEAVNAMREVLRAHPDRVWWPSELQDETRGVRHWSSSILLLAFAQLVEEGELEIDGEFRVHAVTP